MEPRIKLAIALTLALLIASPRSARAVEDWEQCLDNGDFSLNADISFFKSLRVVKSGCLFRFTESEGKGRKLEVNVCDPNTKILDYGAVSSEKAESLYAGSGGCPAPLFGADLGPTQGTSPLYEPSRQKVWEIFNGVKKTLGPGANELNVGKLSSSTSAGSEARLACAKFLLDDYLGNCQSFPEKPKAEVKKKNEVPLPPGIHPATIKD